LSKTLATEPTVVGDASVVKQFLSAKKTARFPKDPVGRHIARLIQLHPNISSKLGSRDLVKMDKAEKLQVLAEINKTLGIAT